MAQQKRNFDMTREMWESRAAGANVLPVPSPGPIKKIAKTPTLHSNAVNRPALEEVISPIRNLISVPHTTTTSTTTVVTKYIVEEEPSSFSARNSYFSFDVGNSEPEVQKVIPASGEEKTAVNSSEYTDDESFNGGPEEDKVSYKNFDNGDDNDIVEITEENDTSFSSQKSVLMEPDPALSEIESPSFYTQDDIASESSPVKIGSTKSVSSPIKQATKLLPSLVSDISETNREIFDCVQSPSLRYGVEPGSELYTSDPAEFDAMPVSSLVFEEQDISVQLSDPVSLKLMKNISELRNLASRHQTVVTQIRRTVAASNPSNQLFMVEPRAEAELSVIVAARKRKGCLTHMAELESVLEEYRHGNKSIVDAVFRPTSNAILVLSKMAFYMDPEIVRSFKLDKDADCFVVIIFSLKEEVYATERMPLSEFLEDGMLFIRNMIRLHPFESDFAVDVEAFLIRVVRQEVLEDTKHSTPGFLKKILSVLPKSGSKSENSSSSTKTCQQNHVNVINLGSMTLTINNVNEKQHRFFGAIIAQDQNIILGLDVDLDLEITVKKADFLTFHCYTDAGTDWIRRYCVLSGSVLSFWRYPDDEEKKLPPIVKFDLKNCVDLSLHKASTQECARPNSFAMHTERAIFSSTGNREETNSEFEYFIAADNKDCLMDWLDKLNRVLKTVHEWKIENH